jgi:cystathionine gamma-synthase
MHDVIGYEENDTAVTGIMESGYPRFFVNRLVDELRKNLRAKYHIPDSIEMLPLMSRQSMDIVRRQFGSSLKWIEEQGCCFLLLRKSNPDLQAVKDFIRHTGILLSSRKAEETLFLLDLVRSRHDESLAERNNAEASVRENLCRAYGAGENSQVMLCSSGMNAVYAVFEAISRYYSNTPRQSIVQAGWLYLDTLEIIRKFSKGSILINSVTDLTLLEARIMEDPQIISAIFTEVPNNPLIECVDLHRLYDLCRQNDIPLVVDATIGTAYNLNILPYCDIAVESLTKFACGKGDVLMGAVILNPASRIAGAVRDLIVENIVEPFSRDLQRLAFNMEGYENRVRVISGNTLKVLEYLERSPAVSRVYSALHPGSYDNFIKIRKHPDALPGLISVVFSQDLGHYYDRLNLAKGPSLGTEFTLAMPYVYLAHYDLVRTPEGREELRRKGLDPGLLRISIGIEPYEEIIGALNAAGI